MSVGSGGALNVGSNSLVALGANTVQFGSSNPSGTVNLNGGTLTTGGLTGSGSGALNFNGGVLQAGTNRCAFLQSITAANVLSDGVTIDTQAFNVTVAQSLLSGHRPTAD